MGIRMTGLQSGLDTEGIIKEMMAAKSLKKTKLEQSKTKLEWTKDKWAELNTKIYALYTEQISKLRLSSSYNVKKATSSNESIATVTASSSATNGTYKLAVTQVATSQYLTSAKLNKTDAVATTKLSEIDSSLVGKEIMIVNGEQKVAFQVKSSSTINDFVSTLQYAGLNASFDEKQGRFFISGKASGQENAFSMTTVSLSTEELAAREALESYIGFDGLNTANKRIVTGAYQQIAELDPAADDYSEQCDKIFETLLDVAYTKKTSDIKSAATQIVKAQLYKEKYDETKAECKANYYEKNEDGSFGEIKDAYQTKFGNQYDILTDEEKTALGMTREEYIKSSTDKLVDEATDKATDAKVTQLISGDADVKVRIDALSVSGLTDLSEFTQDEIDKYDLKTFEGTSAVTKERVKSELRPLVDSYLAVNVRSGAAGSSALNSLGLADIQVADDGTVTVAGGKNDPAANSLIPSGMALIAAQDSIITLNGAQLTSTSPTVSVNGLSISLTDATKVGETVTFTVANDNQGIYDTIKTFVTKYNELLTEMNKLYYADSAKGYEPLTDDEKEAMSESQIELWETKIKDALLRNDSTLGSLMSSMRMALSSSVEVDGKKYSLSSFGVTTSSVYTENGLLHIYGDADDTTYASSTNKLMAAIESDPELVTNVFTQVFTNLTDVMQKKMATSKVSSAMTFYNDKKMKSDIEDYEDQIDEWTERLENMEDSYYDQFSAMETAMAKLNSQLNQLSSLFG